MQLWQAVDWQLGFIRQELLFSHRLRHRLLIKYSRHILRHYSMDSSTAGPCPLRRYFRSTPCLFTRRPYHFISTLSRSIRPVSVRRRLCSTLRCTYRTVRLRFRRSLSIRYLLYLCSRAQLRCLSKILQSSRRLVFRRPCRPYQGSIPCMFKKPCSTSRQTCSIRRRHLVQVINKQSYFKRPVTIHLHFWLHLP